MIRTPRKLTNSDADRLLGLADQYLEDWADNALQAGQRDPAYEERADEWDYIRPLLAKAPELYRILEDWAAADADPEAAERKGHYLDARERRDALLREFGSPIVRPLPARDV